MKRAFLVLLFLGVAVLAQTPAPIPAAHHPGSDPYTPTKRDWLLLRLEIDQANIESTNPEIHFTFSAANDDPDAIVITVLFPKGTAQKDIDKAFKLANTLIIDRAGEYNWTWVKIRGSLALLPETRESQ